MNTTLPYPGQNNMDIAKWENGSHILVAAANFFLSAQSFLLDGMPGDIEDILFGNITAVNGTVEFVMPGNSVAAVLLAI